jgi:hypothetical protein
VADEAVESVMEEAAKLPSVLQRKMAQMALAGWKFRGLSWSSDPIVEWWIATSPENNAVLHFGLWSAVEESWTLHLRELEHA